MNYIPFELLRLIFSYLPIADLGRLYHSNLNKRRNNVFSHMIIQEILSRPVSVSLENYKTMDVLLTTYDGQKNFLKQYYGSYGVDNYDHIIMFSNHQRMNITNYDVKTIIYYDGDNDIFYLTSHDELRFLRERRDTIDIIVDIDVAVVSHFDYDSLILINKKGEIVTHDTDLIRSTHDLSPIPVNTIVDVRLFCLGPLQCLALLDCDHVLRIYFFTGMVLLYTFTKVEAIAMYDGTFGYFTEGQMIVWTTTGVVNRPCYRLAQFKNSNVLLTIGHCYNKVQTLDQIIGSMLQKDNVFLRFIEVLPSEEK